MTEKKQKKAKKEPAKDGLEVRRPIEPELESGELRAGYVALVGRPNVGKSTILNQLLGQKIAATTHKPQTTRKNILGILNPKGAQVLVLDTPGYHKADGPLNRFMVEQTKAAIMDADVLGFVVEAREDGKITPGNEALIELLKKSQKPIVVLINKIDTTKNKKNLILQGETLQKAFGEKLAAIVPVCATKKRGLKEAVMELSKVLPVGEALFDEDELTDQSERALAAEFIREKVMLETREELPYATAVTIDDFEDERPRIVRILATIHVEKDSQKSIIIGRGGERLKEIGTRARKDIEHILGSKVFLGLHVRVTEDWSSSRRSLAMLGYVHNAEEQG